MKLSKFGEKFTSTSGILQLMDDLGAALTSGDDVLMLGGGNPAHIPEVQARLRERMTTMLANEREFEHLVGDYDAPQGAQPFIEALARLLRTTYGWDLGPANIGLTNGSQTAFFFLFNLLAGRCPDGVYRRILLPLAPEYIGYVDVGLEGDLFVASKPDIEFLGDHVFKYRVDFDAVEATDDIAAICVSRPTNPTGNVLTNTEIEHLDALARQNGIPLILDNAYGTPFPNIIFTDAQPAWNDNTILCMSLSKLGLPGTRTGIVIANEKVIEAIAGMNAIVSLAPGSFGAAMALDMVRSGSIINVSRDIIRPYYEAKLEQAMDWVREAFDGLDYFVHKPEGTFFFWFWFRDLPITSQELYTRLKDRGVIIVPGHYFFPGLEQPWKHKHECIRMHFAQANAVVREGIRIIADEVRQAYQQVPSHATVGVAASGH
jgi:valine--pyruvate aminotransferase